jgi:pimeloyl-ACP methyl ester carboxylesterase
VNTDPNVAPSVYDRLRRSDEELTTMLAGGTGRRELVAVFGASEYALLASLARRAQRTPRRHAAPVYVLPGIMGTQLGSARATPAPADLLWLDPSDVIGGDLVRIRLPEPETLHTLGAIPYSYLALQLRLRGAGYTVITHDYDWRIDLRELAQALAARLRAEPASEVAVVAHSMGGLIARAALQLPGGERVRRLVMLGVPQLGSFGAVQAIRGTYPVVRRLAALDRQHDAEFLAQQVFATFPSIHQLLPVPGLGSAPDLWTLDNWPATGPRPEPRLLAAAREFASMLADPDERCIAICGVRQRTVVGLQRVADDFHYQISDEGDGTVPLISAQLARGNNYYVRCEHSALPRSATVARALIELLRQGRSSRLSSQFSAGPGRKVSVSDAALRRTWNEKVDWAQLSSAAHRSYLNRLNQAPPQYALRATRRR